MSVLQLDVRQILPSHFSDAEAVLGEPTGVFPVDPGDVQELPLGGEQRDYGIDGFDITVFYVPGGVSRRLHIIGHWGDGYTLVDWPDILASLGLASLGPPNAVGVDAEWWWDNEYRYDIAIMTSMVDDRIWSIAIIAIP